MKKNLFQFFLLITLLISGLLPPPVVNAEAVCPLDSLKPTQIESLEVFKKIPVLNEGRIKPIETYAKSFLLQLSGRRRYQKETALEWFARFLFAPRTTYDDKIFLINNPDILEAIKVEPEKRRRYSYHQIEPGYDKIKELALVADAIEDANRSTVEREILRLYNNLFLYIRLSGAFAYGFPHPDFHIQSSELKEEFDLSAKSSQFSFYDFYAKSDQLLAISASLNTKKHEEWSEKEQTLAKIINAMFFWTEHYANCPLGIIPTSHHQDEHWMSPMDIIRLNTDEPAYFEEVKHIRNMTMHYWNGQQLEFDLAARAFMDSVKNRLSAHEKQAVDKIPLELLYNRFALFLWAKLFYFLAVMCVLLSLTSENRILGKLTYLFTVLGFVPHCTAIILRIMIMSRPPVSNLYETFIFVGLIGVILGLIIEKINKNQLGSSVAALCGLIFLLIANKWASEGDTLRMLVAVLDSNFWLSTHVITITMGYAACCVAGVMGHIYILQILLKPDNKPLAQITFNNMLGILGFGLTMTFLGTALGGIWADQSWGRFWGWDPKENGALLIVIWCAIIFHARLAKLIHPLGVAVGCVLGLIVVMWAWFGVNLLSIGLHSYGFTAGIANALAIYVLLEFIFLAITVILLGKKQIKI